jgi:hypothetical protein
LHFTKLISEMMRLAWLAAVLATTRAAPDVTTLLARAAALERWVNRTGPAPPSWTVTSQKDVPRPWREVHAGKIKKVYRGAVGADLGGSSIIMQLAWSLLACFQSWASTGHLQNSFKAEQFTMTYKGEVFMVDGPRLLANAPLGEAVLRTWGSKLGESALQKFLNAQRVKCETDDDCPFTKNNHSCRRPGSCEAGARGAPEARGKCLEGTCALLSEKTHVYDVANRPWLLPYIADRATGGDRAFLLALIRHASAEDPGDRPSFAELVAAIDRRVDK